MKNRKILAGVSFCLVLVGSGCSDTTGGTPTTAPNVSTATSSGKPPSPTKSTTQAADNKLKDIDPCELISASTAAKLGITGEPSPTGSGSSRACEWRVRKGTVADSYTIGVVLFEKVGLKDVVADGEVTPLTIGGHEAGQSRRGSGSGCAVSIAITEKSRVDFQAVGGDGAKLCDPVLEMAKLVEPELP